MFFSNNPKIVFVAIPKTGTRTMYNVLENNFEGTLYKEHWQTIPPQFVDYFSFCTIRNPYDRICSMWWSTCKRGTDKRKFIKQFTSYGWENTLDSFVKLIKKRGIMADSITRPQSSFITSNHIDAFLRFEHLEEDFNKLPFVTESIKLPTLNVTKGKTVPNPNVRPDWKTIITDESVNIINEIYIKEFEITGYDMITDFITWKNE